MAPVWARGDTHCSRSLVGALGKLVCTCYGALFVDVAQSLTIRTISLSFMPPRGGDCARHFDNHCQKRVDRQAGRLKSRSSPSPPQTMELGSIENKLIRYQVLG